MKRLKKLSLCLLMLVLVCSMSACGDKEDETSKREEVVEQREDNDEREQESKTAEDEKQKSEESQADAKKNEQSDTSKDAADNEAVNKESEDTKKEETKEEVLDTENLIKHLIDASEGKTMTQVTSTMEMEMSMSMEGVTIDMNVESVGESLIQLNPYKAYVMTEMTMEMAGEEEIIVSESYIVEEDGKMVMYLHDASGAWTRMNMEQTEAELVEQQNDDFVWIVEQLKKKPVSDFVVDTQMHNIGGRDAYKIEFTLTGEAMNQAMNGMTSVTDMFEESGFGELDMSALNVPTVYYVDAETYQVIQMEMEIEGFGEFMNDMMSSLYDASEYQMDISIGKCSTIYSDISYEPVEIPKLPAEAVEADDILDSEASKSDSDITVVRPENGVYTIEDSGAVAQITCPEGWIVTLAEPEVLDIENEETWQTVEFCMYTDVLREDFVSYVEELIVPELQQYEGVYVSHGVGPKLGEYETMEVLGNGLSFYFAWAPVDTGWIFIVVTEFNGMSLEDTLAPILEMIELGSDL